ncbi:MAG TPA: hypothetical protein VJU83_03875 [Burkholderiales bacterium]|nr:hypothetical protein [Burkholderiales bacterium]
MKVAAFARKEFKEVLPPTILFLFLFHMLAITKAVMQNDLSFDALRATTATVAALIVAKAILVVEVLPFAKWFATPRLVHILWRSFLFWLMAVLFHALEEVVSIAIRLNTFDGAFRAYWEQLHWPMFCVAIAWLFGGLLLYSILDEIVEAVGAEKIKSIFFAKR